MPQFNIIEYLLVLFSVTTFSSLGRRLGIKPFFTSSLVGLCLVGLVIASLANFCAGLIKPTLLIIIVFCLILTIKDLVSKRFVLSKSSMVLYSILLISGLILLLINNPSHIFIQKIGNITYLLFNRHYSYYSSQSTEMLNAGYFSRLRVSNLYPYEWTRYHFFNSGARVAAMGLIKEPGLFSYWIAQTMLSVMVLLSFAEIFLIQYGLKFRNVVIVFSWILIGFTLFSDSITWNLTTTGLFSVFATIHLLVAIHDQRWREVTVFVLILGASAFRLLPVAILLLAYLFYYLIKRSLRKQAKITIHDSIILIKNKVKIKLLDFIGLFLFVAYNILTIISAKSSPFDEKYTIFASKIFDNGWLFPLSFYKIWGFLGAKTIYLPKNFNLFNATDFFNKINNSQFYFRIFILTVAILAVFWIIALIKIIFQHFRTAKWFLFIGAVFWLESLFIPQDIMSLYVLTASYFLAGMVFLYSINKKTSSYYGLSLMNIVFFLIAITFLLMHSGLPFSIKGPVSYITFDILLWTIIGIWLFLYSYKKWLILTATALSIILVLSLKVSLFSILLLPSSDSQSSRVDISPIVSADFQRSDFVDSNNFMIRITDDSMTDDAYSAILGADYIFSTNHSTFLNNNFISKEVHEE